MKQFIRMTVMALALASASAWTMAEPAAKSSREAVASFIKTSKIKPENTSYLDHNKQPISEAAFMKGLDRGPAYSMKVSWSSDRPVKTVVLTLGAEKD